MTQKQTDIQRLRRITDLVFDSKLAVLRSAAQARQKTQDQIEGLKAGGASPQANDISAAIAALHYQKWADLRRYELGQVLARQSAEFLDARDAAQIAFGKTRGLDMLAKDLAARRRSERT